MKAMHMEINYLRQLAPSLAGAEHQHRVPTLLGFHERFLILEPVGKPLRRFSMMPLSMAAHIGEQLVRILQQVHRHNIVHRDLSLTNIYLVGGMSDPLSVMLNDFGFAAQVNSPAGPGTLQFLANDLLECRVAGTTIPYTFNHDIASAAKVVWVLSSGATPPNTAEKLLAYWKQHKDANLATMLRFANPEPKQAAAACKVYAAGKVKSVLVPPPA